MQKTYRLAKLIFIFTLICLSQISFAASGRRKSFLSHGPSVTAFGAGETVFSASGDAAVIQYNPSVAAHFKENVLNLSRFNLYEDSAYNSGSFVIGLGKSFFVGASVSNLNSDGIELRENIYSSAKKVSINQWSYILSAGGMINKLGLAYGLNLKYLYYDMYVNSGETFAADFGISKFFKGPVIAGAPVSVGLGLSAQNLAAGEMKVDTEKEDIVPAYRISTSFSVPVYYRFKSKDVVSIYADLKLEDDFLDFYGGLSYTLADKYSVRGGYYPEHFTFGFGIDFYSFTFDYAADFGELDLVNRFGLTFRWGEKEEIKREKVKKDKKPKDFSKSKKDLDKEAKKAFEKSRNKNSEAEKKFKAAKKLYSKGEYLRATDMLAAIVFEYPGYESPLHFYNKISDDMNRIAVDGSEMDFVKTAYAKGYCAYYAADYKNALNEWNKFLHFYGTNPEIEEYTEKISSAMKLDELRQREEKLNIQAQKIFAGGLSLFDARKWVQSIKSFERLQRFVSENNFSKSVEYYGRAKEYIDKAVIELSKTIRTSPQSRESVKAEEPSAVQEKAESDPEGAAKKYNEGLVLYAQGRYLEAERVWELTLRLDPSHEKAKIALSKLRSSGRL